MTTFRRLAAVALLGLTLSGPALAESQPMLLPVDPAPLVVQTDGGSRLLSIEIADDDGERSRGLMYRETMDDAHGMLFVFDQTRPVGFWMKNTPMPLDLIFIDAEGRVASVLDGKPFSEDLIAPDRPVRFVLEVKRGIAERLGIEAGDRVRHPAVDAVAGNG